MRLRAKELFCNELEPEREDHLHLCDGASTAMRLRIQINTPNIRFDGRDQHDGAKARRRVLRHRLAGRNLVPTAAVTAGASDTASAAGAGVTGAGAPNAPVSDASFAAVKAFILSRSGTAVRIRAAGSDESHSACGEKD